MSAQDWAAFCLTLVSLIGSIGVMVRYMVKHYLSELKPNSGTSLRDSVDRLEKRIDELFVALIDKKNKE